MRIDCFQVNKNVAKYAKPQSGMVSLMHVTLITTTRAQRPKEASIL